MDEQQTPPAVPEATQPVAQSAPPEQPTPTTDAAPTTDAGLLAAYTQSQQKLSAVARHLGINHKISSAEQFIAAIDARRASAAAEDDAILSDPVAARRRAELDERERRAALRDFKASADLADTLVTAMRGGGGFYEIAALVDQHVIEAAATRFPGAAPAPAGGPPAPQQAPSGQPQQAPERRLMADVPRGGDGLRDPGIVPDREAGPEGWYRKLFQRGTPS